MVLLKLYHFLKRCVQSIAAMYYDQVPSQLHNQTYILKKCLHLNKRITLAVNFHGFKGLTIENQFETIAFLSYLSEHLEV
jgi:hypothetical protein